MCGKIDMEWTRKERARVRDAYPAGSRMSLCLSLSDSGRSVLVYVNGDRNDSNTNKLMWGYAVIRSGAYALRIRLPNESVDMHDHVALKINQAIWGKQEENYYTFGE